MACWCNAVDEGLGKDPQEGSLHQSHKSESSILQAGEDQRSLTSNHEE